MQPPISQRVAETDARFPRPDLRPCLIAGPLRGELIRLPPAQRPAVPRRLSGAQPGLVAALDGREPLAHAKILLDVPEVRA